MLLPAAVFLRPPNRLLYSGPSPTCASVKNTEIQRDLGDIGIDFDARYSSDHDHY